jgi:hypothetical protein
VTHTALVDAQHSQPITAGLFRAASGQLASGNILRTFRDAEAAARAISAKRGPSRSRIEELDGAAATVS